MKVYLRTIFKHFSSSFRAVFIPAKNLHQTKSKVSLMDCKSDIEKCVPLRIVRHVRIIHFDKMPFFALKDDEWAKSVYFSKTFLPIWKSLCNCMLSAIILPIFLSWITDNLKMIPLLTTLMQVFLLSSPDHQNSNACLPDSSINGDFSSNGPQNGKYLKKIHFLSYRSEK